MSISLSSYRPQKIIMIRDETALMAYGFKGTQDWDFFGFDFEICIISLIVMSKY
jgi:hypothetical protein